MPARGEHVPPGDALSARVRVMGGRGGAQLRAANRELVLLCLGGDGPMSRAGLARRLGLSRATIGAIARELLREGVVREDGTIAGGGGVGRRATLLHRRDDTTATGRARHELAELRRLVARLHDTLNATDRRHVRRLACDQGASTPVPSRIRARRHQAERLARLPAELRARLLDDLALLDARLSAASEPAP